MKELQAKLKALDEKLAILNDDGVASKYLTPFEKEYKSVLKQIQELSPKQ